MTDTKPATEAEVVARISARLNHDWGIREIGPAYTALTAARALGVLLPAEAAALRNDYSAERQTQRDLMAALDEAEAERDALAARLARAEEALRVVLVSFERFEQTHKFSLTEAEIMRAALTPPPSTEAAP